MWAASTSRTLLLPANRTLFASRTGGSSITASRHAIRPFSVNVPRRAEENPSRGIRAPTTTYLTWERYLKLRAQRRMAGMFTTVPSTALAAFASGSYFLTQEIDPTSSPIAGIDPVYVYALLTLGCTGLGYLVGPSLGSAVWSLFHSKDRKQIEEKDARFFQHIARQRVDPSRQTMQNRLPDYYGEKIGSVKDYRQWLRDQATFRRKAAHGVEDDERNV